MAPLNSKILTIIKCGFARTRPVCPPRLLLIGTPDAVNALYTAVQRHMPQALDTDSEAADDSDAQSEDFDSDAD